MNWIKGKLAIAKAIHLDLTHPQVFYGRALQRYVRPGIRWLDVGCGYQILPDWAMPQTEQEQLVRSVAFLAGVDVDERIKDHPLLTYRVKALGGALPFKAETFDLVTANMVVEHIKDPQNFLADIYRVLRPNGRFLFHTPNYLFWLIFLSHLVPDNLKKSMVKILEHRDAEDVFPTHYTMNSPGRIGRLASEAGFEVEVVDMIGSNCIFDRLGPVGWAECFVQKGLALSFGGKLNSNIIAVLKRK
jgi:2-polyprenyl-3-methyl-5-hydroxy-6-metoxy-1,4-benzoquinol methylase